jgi:hypothetical protein
VSPTIFQATLSNLVTEILSHECDTWLATDSPVGINMVKQWVGHCRRHPICQLNYSPSPTEDCFRPTRLIAVGAMNEQTVRLVDNLDLVSGPLEWVALSHCWGKKRMRKRLLNADLDAMKSKARCFYSQNGRVSKSTGCLSCRKRKIKVRFSIPHDN